MTIRQDPARSRPEAGTSQRVPPHNLDAEADVLGSVMLAGVGCFDEVRSVLDPDDFHSPRHGAIFRAFGGLAERGSELGPILVAAELIDGPYPVEAGELTRMMTNATGRTSALAHARIVADLARHRRVIAEGQELIEAGYRRDDETAAAIGRALVDLARPSESHPGRLVDGASFITTEAKVTPLWGTGDDVLWSKGEACIICGPTGIGKGTIAQQLALALIGLRPGPLLGLEIDADPDRTVLYLAMDRPGQAALSLRRMVTDDQLSELSRRLKVWRGPPERDLAQNPDDLLAMAVRAGASVVIVDSLKDAAVKLPDDEVGALWNRAVQTALAAGVEVLVLHHQRKGQQGSRPKAIDDVYGSTWITAGAGSVVLLWGSPGDAAVELVHLKQPLAAVGPLRIEHDKRTGASSLRDDFDLLRALRAAPRGLSAPEAARQWFDVDRPDDNQRRKAKRQLDALADRGLAQRQGAREGGQGGTDAARYFATSNREDDQ